MKLEREEFVDQLQKAYEYFAKKSLEEKSVPLSKENLKHEVRSLAIANGAQGLMLLRDK